MGDNPEIFITEQRYYYCYERGGGGVEPVSWLQSREISSTEYHKFTSPLSNPKIASKVQFSLTGDTEKLTLKY